MSLNPYFVLFFKTTGQGVTINKKKSKSNCLFQFVAALNK